MSTTLSAIIAPISWCSTIGRPPCGRSPQRALGRADRARRDHQPLLDEPVARELVALADLAEHRLLPHLHAVEPELGVLVDERVHVARRAQDGDAGCVLVDEEQRRRALGDHVGEHDQVVGDVADRDEPLLAVDPEAAADPLSGRGDRGRVGAGVALGDGDAVAPLAPAAGEQVALALAVVAGAQRVRRTPDHVPERVREPAELLLDDHLVEHAQPLTAPLGGHVDRVQSVVADALGDLRVDLGREPVAGLARLLVDHDLGSEGCGAVAQLDLVGAVREVHRFV
jgi:hypothetical protein